MTDQRTQALLAQLANYPRLDPRAVIANAMGEGLGGGIGDNGTSFGPFQLHYGGAYPSWAPQGAQASQAWAWSPQGINYALRQINQVAGGLTGANAVANIVSRFERPADIPGAIRTRVGYLGSVSPSVSAPLTTPAATAPAARQPMSAAPTPAPKQAPQGLPAAVRAALRILQS